MIITVDAESFETFDETDIRRFYQESQQDIQKYQRLEKYFLNEHELNRKPKFNSNDPNNKLIHAMCKYVTIVLTGFFIGKPVKYGSEDDALLECIKDILDYNDEEEENFEIAKKMSIHGHCFELLYMDEDANIRFTRIPADEGILFKESTTDGKYLGFMRVIHSKDKRRNPILRIDFYTAYECWTFTSKNKAVLELTDVQEHFWGDVPIVLYQNNEEMKGDFEDVISINDAYDKGQSNTANLFEYNDDAIMHLSKLGDVELEDVVEMRKKGVIITEDGGELSWIMKEINDTATENYKDRLKNDMHLYSFTPKMDDESFSGNLSGVSIGYKMWSPNQIISDKQRKFKKALQRRFELICNIEHLFGRPYDYRDIDITFQRNAPQNDLENAQIVNLASPHISHETALTNLNMVDNAKDELQRIKDEQIEEYEETSRYEKMGAAFNKVLDINEIDAEGSDE